MPSWRPTAGPRKLPEQRRGREYPKRRPGEGRRRTLTEPGKLRSTTHRHRPMDWLTRGDQRNWSGVTCWRRLRDWQQAGVWDPILFAPAICHMVPWLAMCRTTHGRNATCGAVQMIQHDLDERNGA